HWCHCAPSVWQRNQCPIIGVSRNSVSGRNSAPSLVLVGGIVPHHWCQRDGLCPIIGVSGRNSTPSLVSVRGIVPHHWYQWRNSAPSLVSVGGIVPHHWYQWQE
ncbi:unnamed protein product, partial [Staurois parvus]